MTISEMPFLNIFVAATLAATLISASIAVVTTTALRNRSLSDYNMELHRAMLSAMRSSYERDLADINMQLMATKERWVDVNHLLIDSQNAQLARRFRDRLELTPFLTSLGIRDEDLHVETNLIFLLTPFAKEEESTYKAIQTACLRVGLKCVRGDEEFVSGDVLRHIVQLIAQARLVIANIGSRNPNVYYELGIAQAMGKQTLLVSKSIETVPFDLQSQRIILFQETDDLAQSLRDHLLRALDLKSP